MSLWHRYQKLSIPTSRVIIVEGIYALSSRLRCGSFHLPPVVIHRSPLAV